jgi:uncharacterized protein YkwD
MMRPVGYSVLVGLMCAIAAAIPSAAAGAVEAPDQASRATYTTLTSSQFESRLLARTNKRRDARGCRALKPHAALILAARRHTARMVDQRTVSHRLAGEAPLGTRVRRAGYTNWRIVAENLAAGQSGPAAVFRAWVRSAGHRANLDNCRLRHVGFAVIIRNGTPWVTANFGRRSRT